MHQTDIQSLIKLLDSECLAVLEKASHFCVGQKHSQVTIEHYLLQILDDAGNPIHQVLKQAGVKAVDWVRALIPRLQKYPRQSTPRPVFSNELLSWFEQASTLLAAQQQIDLRTLLIALMRSPRLRRLAALESFTRLTADSVDVGFAASNIAIGEWHPAESQAPAVAVDDDAGTLVMTDSEIDDSVALAATAAQPGVIQIQGYIDIKPIGAGGMASVYSALHQGLDREVAIKVLRPDSDENFAERFMREARIVARLNHPGIVQIYDVSQQQDLTYLAMEFAAGGELADRMQAPFSLQDTVEVLCQVLSALQYAHDQGFIHRDIKPANILFRDDGSAVLTDFGIARAVGEDTGLTVAGAILGTPRYMSPEQAQGNRVDHRSDLYSVGVLFYQLLEGQLPYMGETPMGTAMKHILDPLPEFSGHRAWLQPFLRRAMAKPVEDRFQSAQEMVDAMQDLIANQTGG